MNCRHATVSFGSSGKAISNPKLQLAKPIIMYIHLTHKGKAKSNAREQFCEGNGNGERHGFVAQRPAGDPQSRHGWHRRRRKRRYCRA
ncbi:hypothetical protein AGR8A_Lc20109 [Agrobacterium fabrum str. J-07]|nr:hypothetical protein AGR8A_Lc20109 [Agrobacterium fabrum str. J-07]